MKKPYNDFAPRNGSEKPTTNTALIVGLVTMVTVCWMMFIGMSLIEII